MTARIATRNAAHPRADLFDRVTQDDPFSQARRKIQQEHPVLVSLNKPLTGRLAEARMTKFSENFLKKIR